MLIWPKYNWKYDQNLHGKSIWLELNGRRSPYWLQASMLSMTSFILVLIILTPINSPLLINFIFKQNFGHICLFHSLFEGGRDLSTYFLHHFKQSFKKKWQLTPIKSGSIVITDTIHVKMQTRYTFLPPNILSW